MTLAQLHKHHAGTSRVLEQSFVEACCDIAGERVLGRHGQVAKMEHPVACSFFFPYNMSFTRFVVKISNLCFANFKVW